MHKDTQAIHSPHQRKDPFGALSMPVYQNVAYEFDSAADMVESFTLRSGLPDYSRVMNPTVTHLEQRVQALTGATSVTALSSGMAAISNTLMLLAAAGKNIVTSKHLFGNTFSLIASSLARFGVEPRIVDLTDPQAVSEAVDGNTSCIFVEIITNPQMEVADLRVLADIAHSQGSLLVADTTMIPFTEFSAHQLGVDIEVVSSTKYLSGGGTSLGGLVIDYGSRPGFSHQMRAEMISNFGAVMTPQAAYMQALGLETLSVRYQRQAATTLWLAEQLRTLPGIVSVCYPALPDNPFHSLCRQQYGPTASAMLTFDLESEEACFRFINRLQLIHRATNLFDNRTLAIHPASTIFGLFTPEQRKDNDISETLIRLSVGLEDPSDLLADLRQAVAPL